MGLMLGKPSSRPESAMCEAREGWRETVNVTGLHVTTMPVVSAGNSGTGWRGGGDLEVGSDHPSQVLNLCSQVILDSTDALDEVLVYCAYVPLDSSHPNRPSVLEIHFNDLVSAALGILLLRQGVSLTFSWGWIMSWTLAGPGWLVALVALVPGDVLLPGVSVSRAVPPGSG
jgi:hypothetical protein